MTQNIVTYLLSCAGFRLGGRGSSHDLVFWLAKKVAPPSQPTRSQNHLWLAYSRFSFFLSFRRGYKYLLHFDWFTRFSVSFMIDQCCPMLAMLANVIQYWQCWPMSVWFLWQANENHSKTRTKYFNLNSVLVHVWGRHPCSSEPSLQSSSTSHLQSSGMHRLSWHWYVSASQWGPEEEENVTGYKIKSIKQSKKGRSVTRIFFYSWDWTGTRSIR